MRKDFVKFIDKQKESEKGNYFYYMGKFFAKDYFGKKNKGINAELFLENAIELIPKSQYRKYKAYVNLGIIKFLKKNCRGKKLFD